MKSTYFLSVLATLPILATSIAIKRQDTGSFTMVATSNTDGRVNLQPINANNNYFWIGYPTLTSCPDPPVTDCPPGNETVLVAGPDISNGISTSHEAPGEQMAYIIGPAETNAGALAFNSAHSAVPQDGIIDQFTIAADDLIYSGGSWWACPAFGAWYVQSSTADLSSQCISISIFVMPYAGPSPAAWQYD